MAAGISEIQSGSFTRESNFYLLSIFLLLFQKDCYLLSSFKFVLYSLHEEWACN